MVISKIDNFRIWFDVKNDFRLNSRIGGVSTNNKNISWVPITLIKVNELIDEFGFKNEELLDLREKLEDEVFLEDMPALNSEDEKLRPYQNEVVDKIYSKGSLGLFMEMRTGKTPTSVVAVKDHNKIIVSVPNGLQKSWQNAFKVFGDREAIILKSGLPKKREELYAEFKKADKMILIGTIDTLAIDAKANRIKGNFDYLILDEAHFLRNNTQRTKGNLLLRKKAKHALALTGTPSTNKAEDVIPLLLFLNRGSYTKWGLIEYFFVSRKGRFAMQIDGIQTNKQEEWAQFLQRHSVSIKKEEVMPWIPEITHYNIDLEMGAKQRSIFNKMLNEFKVENDSGRIDRVENVLSQMLRLGQIGLDPRILENDVIGAKTKWIKDWVKEHKEEPTIIWSTSAKYIDILAKELEEYNPYILYGETKVKDRQNIVDKFNDGKNNIIIANIRVASTGYTINRATTMIFMDRDWSAIENEQANARFIPTDPNAEKIPRSIINVMCEDSMDEHIKAANELKLSQTEFVNNYKKWLGGQ